MFELRGAPTLPREKVAGILEAIRSENPSYWPNGLTVGHFQPDNLWMLTKSASDDPVGFVGWQVCDEGNEKVGCYSVGVSPEYRRMGLAKQAVAHVVDSRRPMVDRVEALVVRDNTASQGLAGSVGVKVKQASFRSGLAKALFKGTTGPTSWKHQLARNLSTATANTALLEGAYSGIDAAQKGRSFTDSLMRTDDPNRGMMAGLNFLFGLGTGGRMDRPGRFTPATQALNPAIGASLVKDLAVKGIPAIGALSGAAEKFKDTESAPTADINKGPLLAGILTSLGLLGAGGLAYAGLRKQKGDQNQITLTQTPEPGRIRVALPTANPGDKETIIDVPLDSEVISKTLGAKLERDFKRRLRSEAKSRVRTGGNRDMNEITRVN